MKKENEKQDRNLEAIFQETINQFNYSSNLFDSLESKSNTIILSISIILVITLNSFFIEKLEELTFFFSVAYFIGLAFVITSFVLMLNLRKRRFKLIKIQDLKKEYLQKPNRNFHKIIIGKYTPIIQKNFKQYSNKENELRFALNIMKIGGAILIIVIIHMFIIANLS